MPSTATEPLRMKYGGQAAGNSNRQPVRIGLRSHFVDRADAVDVAEHEVAIESAVEPHRPLEIHGLAPRAGRRAW